MTGVPQRIVTAMLAVLGTPLPNAACRGHAPEHDASVGIERPAEREARWRQALARCRRCPVLPDCERQLDHLTRHDDGVLGGRVVLGGQVVPTADLARHAAAVRPLKPFLRPRQELDHDRTHPHSHHPHAPHPH